MTARIIGKSAPFPTKCRRIYLMERSLHPYGDPSAWSSCIDLP